MSIQITFTIKVDLGGSDETRKQANCRKQAKARSPHRKQAFIGRVQNLSLTFILIYHVHISLVNNVYSNIYLDRYLPKKSIIIITGDESKISAPKASP